MTAPPREGTRGGSTASVEEAVDLFSASREIELRNIQDRIIRLCHDRGEFHAAMIESWFVSEPNLVGIAVRILGGRGEIEKLNRHGQVEHRKGGSAAHGRRSYVWRLKGSGDRPMGARSRWARFTEEELIEIHQALSDTEASPERELLYEEIGEEIFQRQIQGEAA